MVESNKDKAELRRKDGIISEMEARLVANAETAEEMVKRVVSLASLVDKNVTRVGELQGLLSQREAELAASRGTHVHDVANAETAAEMVKSVASLAVLLDKNITRVGELQGLLSERETELAASNGAHVHDLAHAELAAKEAWHDAIRAELSAKEAKHELKV